jgi:anti-sigma-K factor RskA
MTEPDEENLIRRFLLGELSLDERERIGERLFADEDFFAQVDAIEDELIDDFALGRMNAADRERFERQFLTTDERRERLKFAWSFHRVLSASHPSATKEAAVKLVDEDASGWALLRRRRVLAFGVTFALLIIGTGAVLLWQAFSRRNSKEQVAATQEQRRSDSQNENVLTLGNGNGNGNQDKDMPRDQGPSETSQPHIASSRQINEASRLAENRKENRRLEASTFAVTLESGSLRGEGSFKKFPVPKGVKTVLLKLQFNNDEEGTKQQEAEYEAELKNGDIKTIHQAEKLRPSPARGGGRFVTVSVPARLLPAGNYYLILRKREPGGNVEGVGTYYFSVTEAHRSNGRN